MSLTLLGSALAYVLTDSGRFIVVNLVRIANMPIALVLMMTFAIGLLAIGGALVAATKLQDVRTQ